VSGKGGSSKRVHYELFEVDSDDEDPYDPTAIESKLSLASNDGGEDTAQESQYSRSTRKMIKRLDEYKVNYDLILELLDYICKKDGDSKKLLRGTEYNIPDSGAILIFLPGMNEIRKLYDVVSSHNVFGDPEKFILIPLHSALSSEHQEKAFDVPPEGIRKIVFSTNIAETGVTISDVTVVIDTGMARVVR
jgi:ATP-dependent RNA helicase DHX29